MADLDTRTKRASSTQIFAPYILTPPQTDGTIDQADRQHIAFSYGGILAGGAPAPPVVAGGASVKVKRFRWDVLRKHSHQVVRFDLEPILVMTWAEAVLIAHRRCIPVILFPEAVTARTYSEAVLHKRVSFRAIEPASLRTAARGASLFVHENTLKAEILDHRRHLAEIDIQQREMLAEIELGRKEHTEVVRLVGSHISRPLKASGEFTSLVDTEPVELEETLVLFKETHTQRHIDQAIEAALRAADRLERLGTREFVGLVNRMRQEIVLAVMESGELNALSTETVKRKVKLIVERYRREFEQKLSDDQRRQFVKGIEVVDKAVKSADLMQAVPYLSEQILGQLKVYNAELISGITDEVRRRIAQEIDLAVMGQKPATDVIKSIGRNLTSPSIFRTIGNHAAVIHRQEVNRIQNLAEIQRLEQSAERIPDLKKKWLHSHVGVPRLGHLALHQVTIPVREDFVLEGQDGKTYRIAAPQDPILPAGDTINCKCKIAPVVGRFEKVSRET